MVLVLISPIASRSEIHATRKQLSDTLEKREREGWGGVRRLQWCMSPNMKDSPPLQLQVSRNAVQLSLK